ncbi:MAG: VIT1/CCC1 transporter family protein [Patescibacteria group bacterium]|nr:VIT1/CCC1 transporter family protein [Patescibacteria group bacterium]
MKLTGTHVRNIVFGVSDSLVSTVGLLSGIDISGMPRSSIVLSGIIYAFVEAFSMAVGSFLSEQYGAEYDAQSEVSEKNSYVAGTVMFVSFALASLIPMVSYIFLPLAYAIWVSITLSLLALLIVGAASAKISKTNVINRGVRMALLGGAAIMIGVIVGEISKIH